MKTLIIDHLLDEKDETTLVQVLDDLRFLYKIDFEVNYVGKTITVKGHELLIETIGKVLEIECPELILNGR